MQGEQRDHYPARARFEKPLTCGEEQHTTYRTEEERREAAGCCRFDLLGLANGDATNALLPYGGHTSEGAPAEAVKTALTALEGQALEHMDLDTELSTLVMLRPEDARKIHGALLVALCLHDPRIGEAREVMLRAIKAREQRAVFHDAEVEAGRRDG